MMRRFTSKSDVWAYGVTCIEMFTQASSPYAKSHLYIAPLFQNGAKKS